MMNAEIKTKWLEALKSGEYKKGVKALRTPTNEFCCLGVLCDLYQKETGKGAWNERGGFTPDPEAVYGYAQWEYSVTPNEVREWAGLPTVNPNVPNVDKIATGWSSDASNLSLAEINDNTDTFDSVIRSIEASEL
jgi:hypothetical protein